MFHPWVRKIHWRRKWQPTPVFLPGKSPAQGSLGGYCPWDLEELDTTEPLSTAQCVYVCGTPKTCTPRCS